MPKPAQLAGAVEYTDFFSAKEYDPPQTGVLIMTLNNLWRIWSTLSLPSLPSPLLSRVVAPDKGPIYLLNSTKLWFLDFSVFGI